MAATLEHCLEEHKISYDIINHTRTFSSMESARTCHISADRIAKSVILEDGKQYLMAVVPASCQVSINILNDIMQKKLSLASEVDGKTVFNDCELGAYPPIGKAYGIETVIDNNVWEQKDIYFEAGDHTEMVHVSGQQFHALLGNVRHEHISRFRSDSHFGHKWPY